MPRGGLRIRDLPRGQRPRERLLQRGSDALSDAELLAVLLRTGGPGNSAVGLAADLLRRRDGLLGLAESRPEDLKTPGLGPAKTASVLAAVEIGRRVARSRLPDRLHLDDQDEVAEYLRLKYADRDQEVVGALYLDSRSRLVAERELYRGILDRSLVEPRRILKEALLSGAAGVLLFHTHPSGDPAPSLEDLEFTERLAKACDAVGVRLLDHLIVARGGGWRSLRKIVVW